MAMLNLVSRILALITLCMGFYFWWSGNTHEMAGYFLLTIILNTPIDKD